MERNEMMREIDPRLEMLHSGLKDGSDVAGVRSSHPPLMSMSASTCRLTEASIAIVSTKSAQIATIITTIDACESIILKTVH